MEISGNTAAQIAKDSAATNPANAPALRVTDAEYIPMDLPMLKLEVPNIPGFYCYWHLGKHVSRAMRSGYQFVDESEVQLNQHGVGNWRGESGSTDLGSRVSVSAGDAGDEKNEERLYLMKLPLALHERGVEMKTARNEQIAVQLRAGAIGENEDPDKNKRYMKQGQDLFYPKKGRR